MTSKSRNLHSAIKPTKEAKLSRTHAPVDLSPVNWQRGWSRQFGREHAYGLENLTGEPFFPNFARQRANALSALADNLRGAAQFTE